MVPKHGTEFTNSQRLNCLSSFSQKDQGAISDLFRIQDLEAAVVRSEPQREKRMHRGTQRVDLAARNFARN